MRGMPVGWVALYVAVVLVPLAVAFAGNPPASRGFVVEFGVAVGFVAFAVLGLQFLLTARFPRMAAPLGLDALLRFHRLAGIGALIAVLVHVLALIAAREEFRQFLNPLDEFLRAAALWAVLGALVLLLVLTIWRRPLGLPYQWWRITHGLLALAVLAIAVAHVFRVGHYSEELWKLAFWAGFAGAAAALLGWTRVVRPLRQLRAPYEVVAVTAEVDRVWTVALEPRGHAGMRFRGGQFAWLTLDQPPWHIDAHPFSFSSSAAMHDRVEFTIKALGDFTAEVGTVAVGARAYLDGPYGNFTLDDRATGAAFIVGGVGITPAFSILRTMRDMGDRRPAWLVYGAGSIASVLRRSELEALARDHGLELTLVLEEPVPGWTGERGLITREVLDRSLPDPSLSGLQYFVCGPGPMMDAVSDALRSRGVPASAVRAERFNIA
jgi:predicted ferric reductase